ncbi:GtrA family protein [Kitasatospora sp. NPDC050543]|uniref:GtrA family protein n=1 Tax=Kitasatospora sp. NPDC050543 TaxID=3364054 RepID=UPI00379EFDD1
MPTDSSPGARTPAPPAGPPPARPARVTRQLPVFAIIGSISTVAYLGLYAALQPLTGAQAANLIALLVTAVANTAANRRFTFQVRGSEGAARHQLQGLVAFAAGLALSSGALALVHLASPHASQLLQLGALIAANVAATALRFVLLRLWVFKHSNGTSTDRP